MQGLAAINTFRAQLHDHAELVRGLQLRQRLYIEHGRVNELFIHFDDVGVRAQPSELYSLRWRQL